MKNRTPIVERKGKGIGGPESVNMKRGNQKPNNTRKGLSLEAFAHARSNRSHYNPASIKKQQEFYKNAKYVSKFRKSMKQQGLSSASTTGEEKDGMNKKNKKSENKAKVSLREIYEKKREEEEKTRIEKEAMIQAKKEERDKANARRKATKEKMYKKTRSGQPVMKYRIEHLLETIQGSKTYR